MHRTVMSSRSTIYISLMLCCFLLVAASHAVAGHISPFSNSAGPSAETFIIKPVPDSAPGDPVRYSIEFSVKLFSILFAWGAVTFPGAQKERLALQLITARPGEYSFTWDSIVPAGANGTATVAIYYLGLPGSIFRQTTTFNISQSTEAVQEYAGSQRCIGCHAASTPDIIKAYVDSGHAYALRALAGQAPAYPSFAPGIPTPPPGTVWGALSYVIGGYAWFASFSSAATGAILAGSEAQYNLASSYLGTPAGFVPFVPDSDRFDCGPCHTTGYVPVGNQDGLTGIVGTWREEGVGCEACHGPGSAHAAAPSAVQPEGSSGRTCADCHVRGSASVVEASGGLILHQQQASELQASPHGFMQCTGCHDPHASAHYDDQAGGTAIVTECTTCHTGLTVGLNMSQLACTDCHMPYAVKAGASKIFIDPALNENVFGDARSHIFKVDTNGASPADMFSDNGDRLAVDGSGRSPGLTVNFVCSRCHTSFSFATLNSLAKQVHPAQ